MTNSNPNSPTNSPLTFRPFALSNRRARFRFMPANDDGNQVPPSVAPATPVGFDLFNLGNLGTSVVLNWSDGGSGSNRATSYTYEWKTSAASTYSTGTTSNTSVEITGLPEDTLHDFRVRAVNDIGQSGYASLTSVRTKLAPPTNVSISRSGTTINLSWTDNSSVETTYLVSRSIDGEQAPLLIGQLSAGTTSFSDPGRSPGYYDYFVTAVKNYFSPNENRSPVVSVSLEYANADGTPLAPINLLFPGVGPSGNDFTSYGVVGPDYVDLSWNPPLGSAPVTSYEVNLGDANIFDYENPIWTTTSITGLTATSTRLQFSDPLPPEGAGPDGRERFFRVRAVNANGSGQWSVWNTTVTSLYSPTNISASVSGTNVVVSWVNNSWAASYYRIYRSVNGGSFSLLNDYQFENNGAGTTVTYTDSTTTEGNSYRYRVLAANTIFTSFSLYLTQATAVSVPASATPTPPTDLFASVFSTSAIDLTWTDASGNETGFLIERQDYNMVVGGYGSWSQVASVGANTTSYRNSGLSEGTIYNFRVRATNAIGNSAYSNEWFEATKCAAPSNFTVTSSTQTSISLSWTNNSLTNTRFILQRRVSGTSNWFGTTNLSGSATSHTVTGLTSGTSYDFRIQAALQTNGGSDFVSTTGSTVAAANAVPSVPTGLSASAASTTQINLTWNIDSTAAPNQADYYEIDVSTDNVLFSPLTTINNPGTGSFSATNLTPATQYWFRMSSCNTVGCSARTASATATTQSGALSPSWSLDFSSGSPWANGTDYTYSSLRTAGTYVASSGYIAPNAANFTTYSEDFTQTTPWALGGLASVTANSGTAPDGSNTAFLLTESVSNTTHRIGQTTNINGLTTASPHTVSVYVKKPASGGVDYAFVSLFYNSTVASTCWTIVNLNNGNIETTNNDGHTNVSARTVNAGNGWYRLILTGTPPAGGSIARIGVGTATQTAISYNVSSGNTKTLLAWGAQVVNGSDPLPYSKTTTAANGIPRLMHNSSGSRLGLLVEEGRTNSLQRSEEFDNAYWTKDGILAFGSGSTANAATAPDNTTTADLCTESSVNAAHSVNSTTFNANRAGGVTCSVYAKKPSSNGRNHVALGCQFTTITNANGIVIFDLTNGQYVAQSGFSALTLTSYGSQDVGNGWYRFWIVVTEGGAGTASFSFRPGPAISTATNSFGRASYLGNGTDGVLLWGAQVENAATPSSYIPTTTQSVTRAAETVHVPDSKITSWGDGALVVHFYPPGQAGTLISTDDAATAQVGIEASTATDVRAFWSSGSTSAETMTTGVQKAVHYWTGSTSKLCLNGGPVRSGTNNFTIANADFVTLGAEATDSAGVPGTFSQYANCIIRKVEFYSGTLTDSQLQAVTT